MATSNHGDSVNIWTGCTTRYYFDSTISSLKSILKKMNLDFAVIDEGDYKDSCCASTLWGIGLSEVAEDNKVKLEPLIKENSQDDSQVVSPCPGCTLTFLKRFDIVKKPLHVTQFLSENLDRMKLENSDSITVTYHDSCHLAKGLGVVEEPRKLIQNIPNIKIKELSYNRENGLCCGSGGGLRAFNKELADSMSSLIVKEAESKGASMIITACPFCERSLNFGKELIGADIKVKNLLNLIDEHLI